MSDMQNTTELKYRLIKEGELCKDAMNFSDIISKVLFQNIYGDHLMKLIG